MAGAAAQQSTTASRSRRPLPPLISGPSYSLRSRTLAEKLSQLRDEKRDAQKVPPCFPSPAIPESEVYQRSFLEAFKKKLAEKETTSDKVRQAVNIYFLISNFNN